jgi:uncharacterized protein YycO
MISQLIRLQTWSDYSHAAFILDEGGSLIEAWQGKGVWETRLKDWEGVERYTVRGMTPEEWNAALKFAREQLGKGYDYPGVFGFVARADIENKDRWFCSELVFAACLKAGVELLGRTKAGEVSPGLLARSPLLERVS